MACAFGLEVDGWRLLHLNGTIYSYGMAFVRMDLHPAALH